MTQARLLGGRYQVGELLGYGGMAEVHGGRDLRLGRDVAIKMLRGDLARDDTFQLRFRREAQNAAALNHPAIVAVYDTGEERGSSGESLPYIVMEFVNGRTLKEVLQSEGRFMPRRALEITAEICAALEFSHRHSIIHRDIKPGNVMLTQTGQVKVMDFGIARALSQNNATMTQTSAVIGTAQYLSPEQARGEAVDARSDVYATGCVLYELLCGQPPFVGDSPVSVAYQHVREEAKAPSLINRDVSPAVDAVVLKALAKNPASRYQSAAEMRSDLLRAAQGRPVLAEPPGRESLVTSTRSARLAIGATQEQAPTRAMSRRRVIQISAIAGISLVAVVLLIIGLVALATPTKVAVPNLVGRSNGDAHHDLVTAGLTPDDHPQAGSSCGDTNIVISQDPAAGTSLVKSSKVSYVWCSGPGTVEVPNVVAMDQATAEQRLTDAKLTYTIVLEDSQSPAGTVLSTDPAPTIEVGEGSSVALHVSKGNLKAMPQLVHLPPDTPYSLVTANAVLTSSGFTLTPVVNYVPVTDPALDGKVIHQDPAAGTLADPSKTTVTLQLGQLAQQSPTAGPSSPNPDSP